MRVMHGIEMIMHKGKFLETNGKTKTLYIMYTYTVHDSTCMHLESKCIYIPIIYSVLLSVIKYNVV